MDWLKKLQIKKSTPQLPLEAVISQNNSTTICFDAFKSHWLQICEVINATSSRQALVQTRQTNFPSLENITLDDVVTVRNLLEQMIFLLIEEQCSGQLLGPILEFTISQGVFQKLCDWWENSVSFKEQIMLNLLKLYEVLISQAQHSLLLHKQVVTPMLKLLSYAYQPKSEELDGHIVLLLNLLCVWMNRDPTLLEIFFTTSANHGPAKFLIFSLLFEYIHREGTVGQQARDALLLCMSLSAENSTVAEYIVEQSNFCPVLAGGLSGLYSTLPRQMEVRTEGWHALQKSDWSDVPELSNFMNSLDFCNSVIKVSHSSVSEQLLDYFYNGFLISVFGPSLHKSVDSAQDNIETSANEVVVTTAYLNLFLRSVSAPPLMRCFLRFLLTHRHENSLMINTLIQRIASGSRLALVSLSLLRTLVDLNCEDLMLQLVFRYLIPCQHILASQRRAICDVDMYNASAARFLALTPACTSNRSPGNEEEIFLPIENPTSEPSNQMAATTTKALPGIITSEAPPSNHDASSETMKSTSNTSSHTVTNPRTMAEFGPDLNSQLELNTSYMDYLEDARLQIDQCREACSHWSARYDGNDPIDVEATEPNTETPQNESSIRSSTSSLSIQENTDNKELTVDADALHSSTSDMTMKALSATYQALNLTALAFNQGFSSSTPTEKPTFETRKACEENKESSVPVTDTNSLPLELINSRDVSPTTIAIKPGYSSTSFEREVADVTDVIGNASHSDSELTIVQSEGPSEKNVSVNTTTSSVDEFFRSLMEIVPKTTRDKVEIKQDKRAGLDAMEEDVESGIEVSSDGDQAAYNMERLADDNDGSGSQQNEDSMSQLSLNTEEMEDGNEKLSPEQRHQENLELSRTYSYTDDTDAEFDDTVSITSTSFYEANGEYAPTDVSIGPAIPLKLQGLPYTGPLIGNLFAKLDQMICNTLHENLLLTGIVTRLAVYPHPLLRSFLLNTHMVFHPSVRSLYQVLTSARNKIDSYAAEVSDFKVLVLRAQKFLLARGTYPFSGDERKKNVVRDLPMPVPKVKTKVLGGMFKRKKTKEPGKKKSLIPSLETLLERRNRSSSKDSEAVSPHIGRVESASMFYVRQRNQEHEKEARKLRELRTRHAVYASIVLAEFLKELAAVAQEHAVAQL